MPRPKKTDLARFKAMQDLGMSNFAISKKTGFDPKTVKYYLNSEVYKDPEIQGLVGKIKEKEIDDLFILGAKARKRLHELLDEGQTKVIETVALMDRVFTQRRLLTGASTSNLSVFARTVELACEQSEEKLAKSIEEAKKDEDKEDE